MKNTTQNPTASLKPTPAPHTPEPYFVVGGKERSGWRNARAAAKREPVAYVILGDQTVFGAFASEDREEVVVITCKALRTPRSGPRYQTELRLARAGQ